MPDLTILYITDNSLGERLDADVKRHLLSAAGDYSIVSVSQRPIELGRNICIGEIGRSWLSLYRGLIAGLLEIDTPFVATVEHDCLYTPEHFEFRPPDELFWYNANHWLLDYYGQKAEGMFSMWPRRIALSQLVVRRERLKLHVDLTIPILEQAELDRPRRRLLYSKLNPATEISNYNRFRTTHPNIDIRHGGNFTGPRRGKHRCYELPYWGRIGDFLTR